MKIWVGITDKGWYEQLKAIQPDEVNFWTPGATSFKVLQPNELFLFKLHAPDNYIVGGGYFISYNQYPIEMAWNAFQEKNGTKSYKELYDRMVKYRGRNNIENIPTIGCILLAQPFFFDKENWIPAPEDWSNSIVRGKAYDSGIGIGRELFENVISNLRVEGTHLDNTDEELRYTLGFTKHRIGQGIFRLQVADAYQRRCAISGEKTLPVLQAAHIKPYAQLGPHEIPNGLLLRSDIHTLFDEGYITVDTDYDIAVSPRLHEDYGNGKDYYKYDGKRLLILPDKSIERPSKEYLEWHNKNVYLEK